MSTLEQTPLIAPHVIARSKPEEGFRDWITRHPVAAFFVGAYAFTWLWWMPSMLGFEGVAVSAAMFVGGFGPAVAGATIISAHGWLGTIVVSWASSLARADPLVCVRARLADPDRLGGDRGVRPRG